ncbi:hypothetical protein [Enterococcus saccharolyticus]|uniref:hypothetical protein n=1 Tax=Enterococcus saccharolyticus TaxID=41997 RepID=UPI001E361414|nr:hypothetical protein [Enterococcus saccharolyticus]
MEKRNQSLYVAQLVASILVVIIHSGTIISKPIAHFILKSMICRLAVPFFLINNAFFFRLNMHEKGYQKSWLFKILCKYSAIFVLYVPFGLQLIYQTFNIQWHWLPFVLVISYVYSGSFYHLW